MPVPQQVLIEAIKHRCEQLDDRYPGYVTDLIGYLAEVLSIERSQPRNVVWQQSSCPCTSTTVTTA